MSYGISLAEAYRLVGLATGRILKGDNPADLPVQQLTKFEFVIKYQDCKDAWSQRATDLARPRRRCDRMRRREFITLFGGVVAWPLAAGAQQADRMRRIGVLMGYAETDPAAQAQVAALRQGLQKLGWEEGRNIHVDVRFPGGDVSAVRTSLMELMRPTPDVLVTNTNLVTAAVQAEVGTIPIVFIFVGDPVGSGFVSDDARPNGNLTGFANWDSPAMSGKWLELVKEIAPQVERVGFIIHPETPALVRYFKSAEALASALNVKLVALSVHDAAEIERALIAFAAEGNGGLIVGPHAVTLTNRDLIVAMAARLRLPAIYPVAFYAQAGGLISYGLDPVDQFQQGAGYVDRILRGIKPADLPVQYPTKLQLVVNLKTAKALGLAIPESFLQRADEVIE
jgi:putative ABC transport system substrate-binding protein